MSKFIRLDNQVFNLETLSVAQFEQLDGINRLTLNFSGIDVILYRSKAEQFWKILTSSSLDILLKQQETGN